MNKKEIIDMIMEDMLAKFYDSKDLIIDLARESLERRTKYQLKKIYAWREELII